MSTVKQTQRRTYYSPDAQSKVRSLSRAVITDGGRTMWLAGRIASDPKADFDTQVRDVFASLDNTIKGAGGSGLQDMVTMTVYTKVGFGDRFVELRKEFFKDRFPASTLVGVAGFNRPGSLVEVQGVAVISGE